MWSNNPLVSVIMPAYNASAYIYDAINSLLNQRYPNWELLVVNDGSTDGTETIVKAIKDSRIRYFVQDNQGVSMARNKALKLMQGDFFCFLDADDALTEKSLELRLAAFAKDPGVMFVDGQIMIMDANMSRTGKTKYHTFRGNPYYALLQLDESCFFGPSWMIRRNASATYQFKEGLTHAEDLLFYICLSREGGEYVAVNEPILKYRHGHTSAMSNLSGLERGYFQLYQILEEDMHANKKELHVLKNKIRSIMFKSYMADFSPLRAVQAYMKFSNL